ncbi:MAG: hypothetical protein RL693_1337 [Verrucomicrobiota bacterium]|jgi:hypothetical protein
MRVECCIMKFASALMVGFLSVSMAHADWPRFRGENGTGVAAADAKPPLKWSSSEGIA